MQKRKWQERSAFACADFSVFVVRAAPIWTKREKWGKRELFVFGLPVGSMDSFHAQAVNLIRSFSLVGRLSDCYLIVVFALAAANDGRGLWVWDNPHFQDSNWRYQDVLPIHLKGVQSFHNR